MKALTERQQQVYLLGTAGKHAGEIAAALGIPRGAVYRCVSAIRQSGRELNLTPMPVDRKSKPVWEPTEAEKELADSMSSWKAPSGFYAFLLMKLNKLEGQVADLRKARTAAPEYKAPACAK